MLKDSNYLTILPFMIQDLGLSRSSLIIYATIYSFSQDEKSQFSGSIEYLSEWTGIDRRNVINNLDSLSNDGLIIIEKRPGYTDKYRINPEKIPERLRRTHDKTSGGGDKTSPLPVIKHHGGG